MNILILDDVRLIRETVKESLSSLKGWELTVREASNGYDALDIIGKFPIDVVLVDIKMPRMSGLEFIKKAVKVNRSLRFVILSSFSEFEYARSALKLGVSDYLLKPVSDEELESVLTRIGEELKSGEKELLDQMESDLQNFFNYPVEENKPDNAIFFCFHPKAGMQPDITFYKRINQLLDDLSCRLNRMGIPCLIRSGDNQWYALLFSRNDQIHRIRRELEEVDNLIESVHLLSLFPDSSMEFPCYSEHRSLFFRNLAALSLIGDNSSFIDRPDAFSLIVEPLRELSDSLTAMAKGIYIAGRSFHSGLDRALEALSQISPDVMDFLLGHLVHLFSLGIDSWDMIDRRLIAEKIEAEYMRHQFKSDNPFPGNVIAYVEKNYMYPINIAEIADHLHKTPNALSTAFRKASGQTLSRFITSVRIENAGKLLLSTELNSKQIGEMVGISDAGYFCKVFKDKTGLSPMDFRKKNATGN